MTAVKGFLVIILSGIAFALGGGGIGYALAVLTPGYYRGVFSTGREPWFDPVEVGLGLGITQGLISGLIMGAVVVLAVAWYASRRSAADVSLPSRWAGQRAEPRDPHSPGAGSPASIRPG
jgi:hypothetical protein